MVLPIDHVPGFFLGVLLAVGGPEPQTSNPAPTAPAPPPPACRTPEHRQFDFWLGDWTVTDPTGKQVGTNRIALVLGGCVKHRITWSKFAQGRVRQLWESSTDAGATWTVAFDGTYTPKAM